MFKESEQYPMNAFRICVNECEGDIGGVAYSPLTEEIISYNGAEDLMIKMDRLFDACGYPQAFQERRSFSVDERRPVSYQGIPKASPDARVIQKEHGKVGTYDIMVTSRRRVSWQGVIYENGVKAEEFHSDMEFLQFFHALI